jgi:hypothetical protein
MPTDIAKYSIELFKPGGEGAGIEEILDRHADLKVASAPGAWRKLGGHRALVRRAPDHHRAAQAEARSGLAVSSH